MGDEREYEGSPEEQADWERWRAEEAEPPAPCGDPLHAAAVRLAEAVDNAERTMSTDGAGGATPADLLSTLAAWTGKELDAFRKARGGA